MKVFSQNENVFNRNLFDVVDGFAFCKLSVLENSFNKSHPFYYIYNKPIKIITKLLIYYCFIIFNGV